MCQVMLEIFEPLLCSAQLLQLVELSGLSGLQSGLWVIPQRNAKRLPSADERRPRLLDIGKLLLARLDLLLQ
ncbi:hypothetical protein D3C78_684720 [compost metagenome]